jgi:hypothetical protein
VPQLILRATAGNPTLRFRDTADNNTIADFFVTNGSVSLKAGVSGLQILNNAGTTTYYILAQAGMTVNAPIATTGNVTITKADISSALSINYSAAAHWIYCGGVVRTVISDTYVDMQVNAVHVGKQIAAAIDTVFYMKNTQSYNTIMFTSYAPDGTGAVTDGYIQSQRNGPLAVSGGTGIDFRVFNTRYGLINVFGMTITGSIQAKSSTPDTHGFCGLMPGNATNSGYFEFYTPDQLRAGYFGFATAAQVSLVTDGPRKLAFNAQDYSWQRNTDNVILATLAANGQFETFYVTGKGSTGTMAGANIVQSIEARSAAADQGAWMAFHSPGARAMHIGLDSDNQFKIGGWGWTGAKFRFMDTGNLYCAGNIIQMEAAGQCELQFGPAAAHGICYMSPSNAGFYRAGGSHTYQEMAAGGWLRASGPISSGGKAVFRNSNPAFASAEIFIGSGAPSGGADGDVWLQYV